VTCRNFSKTLGKPALLWYPVSIEAEGFLQDAEYQTAVSGSYQRTGTADPAPEGAGRFPDP